MAPSGEHRPENLGYSAVHAAAVATGNAAIALRQRVTQLHTLGAGKTVAAQCETLTAQAVAAEKIAANLGTTAAALRIREEAAKAWNRDAPKDSELEAARKAVADAQQQLKDAAAASGDTSAASSALEAAQKRYKELKDRRKRADEVYDAAEKRADAKLAEIKGGYRLHDESRGHSADGTPETPSAGTPAPSTGTGRPSGETGTPSAGAPGSGKTTTGKPSTTPAATPSSTNPPSATTKPSSTETEASTATPDSTAALAALLASQQQQPQAQAAQQQPTAQAAPAATAPVASTPTQQGKDKDLAQSKTSPLDKILGADGILDTGDLAGIIGTPLTLGGGSAPTHATPAAAVTPSAPAASAPSTTGLSAGTVTQPVTSGTSATGLNTATDVSGRTAEQQRGAFSVGPETKTSGATSTGTSGATPASATGTRPMGAGGMPMVPMGAMGGPGSGAGKDREQAQTTLASGSEESYYLHGRQAVDAAVPGGTIAQKDHPRRRPESDAA
ncbi:hypothetical protein [Mycobacteroides abscessus]|uniref:hypothetical protein n=1 Tax=Mycobacteroides abscessus TaxID=36809 RepID=UPI002102E21D|nr:hypothetical protein [Mycobacteroides abscessus]